MGPHFPPDEMRAAIEHLRGHGWVRIGDVSLSVYVGRNNPIAAELYRLALVGLEAEAKPRLRVPGVAVVVEG